MSWRARAAAWGGPVLIVAFVVFSLRGFVFSDLLSDEHPDILSFWLPRWTHLGRSLAAGDLPLWNPFEMTGYRFAADPQSGWLYAPAMALFTWLGPTTAMRAMIVLNPLVGGLGLWAFLRSQGLGRAAAALGGLALAGLMSASEIAISMPFAGAVAWTTVVLFAASRCMRAGGWPARWAWIGLGGFAWSQAASAHLSHGLVAGTAIVVAVVVGAAWGRRDRRLAAGAFLAALPILSLAVLIPRFQFLGASSLGAGYAALGAAAGAQADASVSAPIADGSVWLGWPFAFATAPGAYLGAAALLVVPLAMRSRDLRRLAVPVAAVLVATWVLLTIVGWEPARGLIDSIPYGDVLLHNPGRLRYVAVLALPILAACGLQGLVDEPLEPRLARIWVGAGATVWLLLPLALGGAAHRWLIMAIAVVPAAWIIVWIARRPDRSHVLVALLAIELAAGATWGAIAGNGDLRTGLEGSEGGPLAFQPLRYPDVDAAAYVRPTVFVDLIGEERFLTWAPPAAAYEKGYLFAQEPADWPALANERGTLFAIRDALGYNPVQLPRYWTWIREHNPLPLFYNASVLARPTSKDLEELGVNLVVLPEGVDPPFAGERVAGADGYELWRVGEGSRGSAPVTRVSATELLIEDPGATVPIDEAYDPGWTAVAGDGRPVTAVPAGPSMELLVPDGAEDVRLTYRDPWVTGGLWAGAAAWSLVGVALLAAWVRSLSRSRAGAARPR